MQVSVSDAKKQLAELVRRAEAGEEVILTRRGQAAVRLAPVRQASDRDQRREVLERFQTAAAAKISPGSDAERSQDFLYDADGLPG
jgi:prevent-host-death family protein